MTLDDRPAIIARMNAHNGQFFFTHTRRLLVRKMMGSPKKFLTTLLLGCMLLSSFYAFFLSDSKKQEGCYQQKRKTESRHKLEIQHFRQSCLLPNSTQQTTPPYCANTNIRMERVYDEIPFNNLTTYEGWQLGFPVTYDRDEQQKEPMLEVILMPYTHNDPGHLKTFEDYYNSSGSAIPSATHRYLTRVRNATLGYAEVSFLELWWRNHGKEERESFKRVVESGQLEILTGGWVVPDEANTHYYALIMQLLEGHEWLRNHLLGPNASAVPVTHWNTDSFGCSPTMAYLVREAGLKQGILRRVHYAVKSYLAERQQLEFRWRQLWAGDSDATDFPVHVFPLSDAHISESCGVDPHVCCQFDFEHVGSACLGEWGGRVVAIEKDNVDERADLLADQFRKKAQLYRGNVIFVPWGEDRRYTSKGEWDAQVGNLSRLFDHINSRPDDYNMHVRFGTAREYFDELRRRLPLSPSSTSSNCPSGGEKESENEREKSEEGENSGGSRGIVGNRQQLIDEQNPENYLPTLSGDFFTYAENNQVYWSGYFTTRAFLKHMDRTVQHYLRSADILYTAANNHRNSDDGENSADDAELLMKNAALLKKELLHLNPQLVEARRQQSIFQHHDAIAGTSLPSVVEDYAQRMLSAIHSCEVIITRSTAILLGFASSGNKPPPPTTIVQEFPGALTLPHQRVIGPQSELVLFNPLGHEREEVICVLIPMPLVSKSDVEQEGEGKRENRDKVLMIHEYVQEEEGQKSHGIPSSKASRSKRSDKQKAEGGKHGNRSQRIGKWKPLAQQQLQPEILVDESGKLTLANDKQKLCFLASLPALGLRRYYLDYATGGHQTAAKVLFKGDIKVGDAAASHFDCRPIAHGTIAHKNHITIANNRLSIEIDPVTGFMKRMTRIEETRSSRGGGKKNPPILHEDASTLPMEFSFEAYQPNASAISSATYIFMPKGPSERLPGSANNTFILVDGPVRKSVVVKLGGPLHHVVHSTELDIDSDAPSMRNLVDLTRRRDVEVVMRVKTSPQLARFYTELNAFQFIRRQRHLDKLPLAAHFFPMPGAALIEGGGHRLSLLGRQALGVASLEPGWIEVMLDRHLTTEDGHWPLYGEQDKHPTESSFRLVWEEEFSGNQEGRQHSESANTAYHSPSSYRSSLQLNYPVVVQFRERHQQSSLSPSMDRGETEESLLAQPLPNDVHLVALRTLSQPTTYREPTDDGQLVEFTSLVTKPRPAAALILYRTGVECRLQGAYNEEQCARVKQKLNEEVEAPEKGAVVVVKPIFGKARPKRVSQASLTLLRVAEPWEEGRRMSELVLKPMEVKSWKLEF